MANLIFFDTDHKYQLNGEELPSVSELTRFISKEVYGEVNQTILDNAASRGTAIHKGTEALDKYGKVEIESEYVEYVKAYVKFRKEHSCEWQKIECAMFHKDLNYAGTIDRYGIVDGKKTLLDIKTSSSLQKVLYGAQLNLYRMMLESNGIEVDQLIICHLQKDGAYKLVEFEKTDEVANACLTLHGALKKKARKKKNA